MEQFSFRYAKVQGLIFAMVILTLGLISANKYLGTHWGFSFSVFAIMAGIFGLINNYFWNKRPCSWLYSVPDFTGIYKGTLKYEYRDDKGELCNGILEHTKTVKQNGSCIVVRSQTRKSDGTLSSESLSIEASIIKEVDGTFTLMYNYLNNGDHEQGFSPHYGTEVLKLTNSGNQKALTGKYYTDRQPFQTQGKIDLKKINN